MPLTRRSPTGVDFLDAVTTLLQDARLAEPLGGQWEAADLQWSWRTDQRRDASRQCFWYDGGNAVVAAVLTARPGRPPAERFGVDLLGTDAVVEQHGDELWAFVEQALAGSAAEMLAREDHDHVIAAARAHGFVPTDEGDRTAWLDAGMRPRVPALAAGYELLSYTGGPHPMAARNGADVAARLAECSLYDPQLDLAVHAADGSVAGYALFWADPVTGVGLVEPMRVEDAHQGRGLGRVLLAAGLDRLAAQGCSRLKVSFDPTNEPAARLYTRAGFGVRAQSRTYARDAVGTAP